MIPNPFTKDEALQLLTAWFALDKREPVAFRKWALEQGIIKKKCEVQAIFNLTAGRYYPDLFDYKGARHAAYAREKHEVQPRCRY